MKRLIANEFTTLVLIVVLAGIALYREPEHAWWLGTCIIAMIALLTAVVIAKQRYPLWFYLTPAQRASLFRPPQMYTEGDDNDDDVDYEDELDFRPLNNKEG